MQIHVSTAQITRPSSVYSTVFRVFDSTCHRNRNSHHYMVTSREGDFQLS